MTRGILKLVHSFGWTWSQLHSFAQGAPQIQVARLQITKTRRLAYWQLHRYRVSFDHKDTCCAVHDNLRIHYILRQDPSACLPRRIFNISLFFFWWQPNRRKEEQILVKIYRNVVLKFIPASFERFTKHQYISQFEQLCFSEPLSSFDSIHFAESTNESELAFGICEKISQEGSIGGKGMQGSKRGRRGRRSLFWSE